MKMYFVSHEGHGYDADGKWVARVAEDVSKFLLTQSFNPRILRAAQPATRTMTSGYTQYGFELVVEFEVEIPEGQDPARFLGVKELKNRQLPPDPTGFISREGTIFENLHIAGLIVTGPEAFPSWAHNQKRLLERVLSAQ